MRHDPTRTTLIQRAFGRAVIHRMEALRKAVTEKLVDKDSLGDGGNVFLRNTDWKFLTDPQKVEAYRKWLQAQIDAGLLEVSGAGDPWLKTFIESAYKKATARAFTDAKARELDAFNKPLFFEGAKSFFSVEALGRGERLSKIQLLATRALESLRGVSAEMSADMTRILADGLAHGKGPREIAREMSKVVEGLGKKRALVIARTEIVHAHAEGQLDAFEELGIEGVGILAEWSTAGDEKVCPACGAKEGILYTIDEARGMIPLHPNCVTGDMVVESPDPLAVMKAMYTGRIIEITTAKGRRLSITENHILLTKGGWVPAKLLKEGDKLFDASSFDGLERLHSSPDDHYAIPCIEKCFHSLVKLRGVSAVIRASTRPEYFHGDGRFLNQEINIVSLDGVLGYNAQSQLQGQFQKLPLVLRRLFLRAGLTLASRRSFAQGLETFVRAADSLMSVSGVQPVLFRGAFAHHQTVGLSRAPFLHICSQKFPINDSPAQVETFRQTQDAVPLLEESNDFLGSLGENYDTLGKLTSRHEVNLPVYDVNTASSAYLLNGLLSSNCRCAWIPSEFVEDRERVKSKMKGDS